MDSWTFHWVILSHLLSVKQKEIKSFWNYRDLTLHPFNCMDMPFWSSAWGIWSTCESMLGYLCFWIQKLESHDYRCLWVNKAFLICNKLLDEHLNEQEILHYVGLKAKYRWSILENKIPALKCSWQCKKKKKYW